MNRVFVVSLLVVASVGFLGAKVMGQPTLRGTVYKIGFTTPLTGPLSTLTSEHIPAAELAIADINSHGGINGHPVQLATEDSQGTPQGGLAALRKLVQVDGVQACVSIYTNVATAQIPLADQLRVPIIAPVEGVGVMSSGQYSFAHAVTFPDIAPFIGDYWQRKKAKRVFGFFANNGFGQGIAPSVRDVARAAGADYDQAFVDLGTTDFRGVIERAKAFNADQIFLTIQGSALETSLIRQIREVGITAQLMEPGTFYQSKSWREGAGPYAEGMIFAGIYVNPAVSGDFVRAYRARVGSDPVYGAALIYDMVKMLAYAIGKSSYNGEAIRGALLHLRGVPSVLGGQIEMKDNHYTKISAIGLWQVRAGKLGPARFYGPKRAKS